MSVTKVVAVPPEGSCAASPVFVEMKLQIH